VVPGWLRPVSAALDARAARASRAAAARASCAAAARASRAAASRAAAAAARDHRAAVFFRDDDAGWDDARLFELLALFARHDLPLDLAVIPDELDTGLARALYARPVGLHQHGFAHVNHEREGRKCEFGPGRDVVDQVRDIVAGQTRMRALLGDRVDPIFTPPWNRCTPDTARALGPLGFEVLSRESGAEPLGEPGLLELPVSVDFVRLDPVDAGARIAETIAGGGPVGVMLHHAVMDADLMRRAGELLELVAGHEHARAAGMMELARAG
jgi:peptidoglycan/xylan/chitin deacetylase (PgdA/CDA1 family)